MQEMIMMMIIIITIIIVCYVYSNELQVPLFGLILLAVLQIGTRGGAVG
jgi:hypothetical protein